MKILKVDELIDVCKALSSGESKVKEEIDEMLVQALDRKSVV